ncbi:MAG: pyridoxamine 5'-phosphate oxidase family protein [Vitreimonas sp.]
MNNESEIRSKFWKSLRSDMTLMLGLTSEEGAAKPMTAQFDGKDEGGPIYFFTAKETGLVRAASASAPAIAYFVSKGHDVFASITGTLTADNDRAVIDRLWNAFVAVWYDKDKGKDDPNLQLLRFDPDHAHIWLSEHSLMSATKLLLGKDPKREYKDKVADVPLN